MQIGSPWTETFHSVPKQESDSAEDPVSGRVSYRLRSLAFFSKQKIDAVHATEFVQFSPSEVGVPLEGEERVVEKLTSSEIGVRGGRRRRSSGELEGCRGSEIGNGAGTMLTEFVSVIVESAAQ